MPFLVSRSEIFLTPLPFRSEFIPKLQAFAIPLPQTDPAFSFVIANTLVTSNKAVTAKHHYNLRVRFPHPLPLLSLLTPLLVQVVETRLGALLLAKHLNLPFSLSSRPFPTFKAVLDAYFHTPPPPPGPVPKGTKPPTHRPPTLPTAPALPSSKLPGGGATKEHELRTMSGLVVQALGGPGMEDGMTWKEVAEKLEVDAEDLEKQLTDREVEAKDGKFKVWTRARHVVRFFFSLSLSFNPLHTLLLSQRLY